MAESRTLHDAFLDELRDAYDAEERQGSDLDMLLFGVLGIAIMPLVWYFLLDRIREISGAMSGRDRP